MVFRIQRSRDYQFHSLLDILANRKSSSRVGGRVLFNSEDIMPNFRFKTGYVVQVCSVLVASFYPMAVANRPGGSVANSIGSGLVPS